MDTSKDPRILFGEKVINILERSLQSVPVSGKKELFAKVKEMQRVLTQIKYSYLNGAALRDSDMAKELKNLCGEIARSLGKDWDAKVSPIISANIKFALNNLFNLPDRMLLPNDPAYACDIRKGKIISVEKGKNVLICKVDVGTRKITVVTNDLSAREGNEVAVAFLPPAEIYGIVSEGMFLGAGEGILKNVKGKLGELPHVPKEALEETRRKILAFIGRD